MATLRTPVLGDYRQLESLGRWFQTNSAYQKCGWSEEKFASLAVLMTDRTSAYFGLVAEQDGEIIGLFLGTVCEYFFSEEKIAMDQAVVFAPDKRKGIGKLLIQMIGEFEQWAKQKGAIEVCLGVTSGIAGEGYEKLIQRAGFNRVGSIFKREV